MSLTEPGTRKCPYCAEEIQAAAVFCKHCRRRVAARLSAPVRRGLLAAAVVLALAGIVGVTILRRPSTGSTRPSAIISLPQAGSAAAAIPTPQATAPLTIEQRMSAWAIEYKSGAASLNAVLRRVGAGFDGDSCSALQQAISSARIAIPSAPDKDVQNFFQIGLNTADDAANACNGSQQASARMAAKVAGSSFGMAESLMSSRYHLDGLHGWPDLPSKSEMPAEVAAVVSETAASREQTIRSHCTKEWPTDYHMQSYCTDEQHKALAALLSGRPADVPEAEFSRMRQHCASEWPEDFHMRAYCEKEQADGYRKIN
jgi:hypothetical protein